MGAFGNTSLPIKQNNNKFWHFGVQMIPEFSNDTNRYMLTRGIAL